MVLVSELYIVASTISAIFNLLFITIAVIGYWRKKKCYNHIHFKRWHKNCLT